MDQIQQVVVVGGGVMGAGIAELLASKRFETTILEKDPQAVEQAKRSVVHSLDRKLAKWGITEAEKKIILSNMHFSADPNVLRDADFVIESVDEDMQIKKEIYQLCDQFCRPEVVFASNTSTLSLTEIAAMTQYPEKVIGLHFVYPVPTIPVVEVVRGLKTSDQTVNMVRKLLPEWGLSAVEVFESPGFVTTRMIVLMINEATNILMEGVATVEEIDRAMKLGYQFHAGPFEMADRFGLDSVLAALEQLFREFGEPKFRPAPLLKKMVRAKQLGVKTGEGFFRYDQEGIRMSDGEGSVS
ncbi:3-hydroxyacyl-CoA dehydrogenase family protein [Baia soyae]|uniref:3-hydroxybutyryl-CoA dehydrogenase n=1 Tax=Baia soyae TaxID=1544746 RepID=A0A4R2RS45_9BACL|nr:3-hydroxyacyl-CoA dehydrogenase NAD-binding domain-containing protein [Baia soyae]TCP67072.1 3-hydroxybutyryl-CoA dehydrogenase [Baia soyae]